jgi:DNA ligase-1
MNITSSHFSRPYHAILRSLVFFTLCMCAAVSFSAMSRSAASFSMAALSPHSSTKQTPTGVQLAQVYENENIDAYLVSEKYDGIRAIWKNNQLRTRNGHIIHTPAWFTQHLPNVWLDGELWYKREAFEFVASTVSKNIPVDDQWRHITYRVFDAPNLRDSFKIRAQFYTALLNKLNIAHIKPVKQFKVNNNQALMALLTRYTKNGSEGLMLQKANALFADGRSGNLLKLKRYMDAEATVLKHLPGKGKYTRSMGAILVEHINDEGNTVQFKIGTGFSDAQRKHPPPVGTTVTFAYHGYTMRGIPRFASFIRIRNRALP